MTNKMKKSRKMEKRDEKIKQKKKFETEMTGADLDSANIAVAKMSGTETARRRNGGAEAGRQNVPF
uniref:Uncharacterized protein n=1 Tax=Romanomermis culicivorax TaxID=13658 RepID=A0A915ISH1_ROMCU